MDNLEEKKCVRKIFTIFGFAFSCGLKDLLCLELQYLAIYKKIR